MTYRDDREADQARIEALEHELEVAKEKLAVLEGRQSQALVLASPGALVRDGGKKGVAWWFGAPGQLQFARRFDGAFPVERFEELVERIRGGGGGRGCGGRRGRGSRGGRGGRRGGGGWWR